MLINLGLYEKVNIRVEMKLKFPPFKEMRKDKGNLGSPYYDRYLKVKE